MKQKSVQTIAMVLLVVACAAAAATVSFYAQQRRVLTAEAGLRRAAAKQAELGAEIEQLKARLAEQATSTTTPTEPVESGDTAPAEPEPAESEQSEAPSAAKPVKQFAFIDSAKRSGSTITFKLDYADFLTGKAAAKAAKAAGDESPPPNDYYISNSSTKLRTLTVSPSAKFTIAYFSPEETEVLSADEFYDIVRKNTDGAADAGYWFWIEDGDTVTKGEELWTP
jgi:hypothetical protein